MNLWLFRKLLRDVRVSLVVVALLLGAFQCLWAKITARISGELVTGFSQHMQLADLKKVFFNGPPGKLMRAFMGGEDIAIERAQDVLTIGFVHPLVQTILCIWAIGRAAGAIAGEMDRGTLELLMAQPVPRRQVIVAHLGVDLLTIPLLCLSMWAGISLGCWLVSPIEVQPIEAPMPKVPATLELGGFRIRLGDVPMPAPSESSSSADRLRLQPEQFGRALASVAALLFAVSGYTMWISASGRFRSRVLGIAVLVTLLQFLANAIGQLWDTVAWLRAFTVFYYYRPQQIALHNDWRVDLGNAWNGGAPLFAVNGVVVLMLVGAIGYALALWTFSRRDLPAPL